MHIIIAAVGLGSDRFVVACRAHGDEVDHHPRVDLRVVVISPSRVPLTAQKARAFNFRLQSTRFRDYKYNDNSIFFSTIPFQLTYVNLYIRVMLSEPLEAFSLSKACNFVKPIIFGN